MILGGNTPDPAKVAVVSKSTAKLTDPVNINGVPFDGSTSITITASDSTARIASSEKGAASGVCPLDSSSKVPSAYLPSYVDDVLEYANLAAFPGTGETGKIYIALDTNFEYRWSGSVYIRLVASPGTTDALTEGTSNLYFTAARVLAVVLSGLSTATSTAITAGDSILSALGKLQAQINGKENAITSGTSAQYFKGDKSLGTFETDALAAAPAETAITTGALISGASAKTTPVDADTVGISDSAASGVLKKMTWANIKATLKTYFDGLYPSSTQPAWTAPTLLNSWVNFGSPYDTAAYMIDTLGFVHLKGMVKSGTVGAPIFALPAGYRPAANCIFAIDSNSAYGNIWIESGGNVTINTGSNTWAALGGITFKAA